MLFLKQAPTLAKVDAPQDRLNECGSCSIGMMNYAADGQVARTKASGILPSLGLKRRLTFQRG